jgi:tripartite-type tricarboxylate transporter receptor subunit TctC
MELPRRTFLRFAGACVAAPVFSELAKAQSYPTRPITMIVPAAAGGPTDAAGRIMAEGMRNSLGRPVIIENISGADASLGTGRVARAKPDGYTIGLGLKSSQVLNGAFYSLPYDVLNDFAPVALLSKQALIMPARKTLPAKDVRELIAWLKDNPNQASVAVVSVGARLLATLFQKETGTQFAFVPYRGVAPALQDLVAGQIDLLFFDSPRTTMPLVRAGSIKAYAVTSAARHVAAPDIPTFAEMGLPALTYFEWIGFFAPRGTPRDIIGKLNTAVTEALADPAVRSRYVEFGAEIFPREEQTPEALDALVKADAEKWWPIIKELGIKAQ